MFIENKYYQWYNSLVSKCRQRGLVKKDVLFYTEKHHIIPKSLGGADDKYNLVLLSAREHYLAHWLLTKFTDGDNKFKMICGFYRMTNQTSSLQQRVYTSGQYEIARVMHAKAKSDAYKGIKQGPKAISEEGKQKMKENGRRTAEINRNKSSEEKKARNKKISDTMKMKPSSENSLKNLVKGKGKGFNTNEGRLKANETRKRSQGKKVIVDDAICFLTLKDAAIHHCLTIDAAYYRVKTNKFNWCEI